MIKLPVVIGVAFPVDMRARPDALVVVQTAAGRPGSGRRVTLWRRRRRGRVTLRRRDLDMRVLTVRLVQLVHLVTPTPALGLGHARPTRAVVHRREGVQASVLFSLCLTHGSIEIVRRHARVAVMAPVAMMVRRRGRAAVRSGFRCLPIRQRGRKVSSVAIAIAVTVTIPVFSTSRSRIRHEQF